MGPSDTSARESAVVGSFGDEALEGRIVEAQISGMSCVACARRVERALRDVEGVLDAHVDLVRERARIRLVGAASVEHTIDALRASVERAGYGLEPEENLASAPRSRRFEVDERLVFAWLGTCAAWVASTFVPRASWLEVWTAAFVVIGAGFPILRAAREELRTRSLGMSFLLASGALAALASGLAAPLDDHGAAHANGHGHSDATMAALVVSVALTGRALERRARARAAADIEALRRTIPATARVFRHGQLGEIPASEVRLGDEVRVAPFERVPVDGELLPGSEHDGPIALDESVATGESRPVERRAGAVIFAGSLNLDRPLRLRATAVGIDSTLGRVMDAVARARNARGALVRLADRVSGWLALVVWTVAFSAWLGWLAAGASFGEASRIAATVLVVACPCALGLATPVAVTVALGRLAARGIFVRDLDAIERLARTRTFVFDKTGTLTEGAPRVVAMELAKGVVLDEARALALAAALEVESRHPVGRAIFEEAMRRGLSLPVARDVRHAPGRGVDGVVEGRSFKIARPSPVHDVSFERTLVDEGLSVAELCENDRPLARFGLDDALRPETAAVLTALRSRGLLIAIRSGDAVDVVKRVARRFGVVDAQGALQPGDKLASLAGLPRPLAMVGDGVNDAPAMAGADVGIALGSRAEATLEAAAVVLARPDLRALVEGFDVARAAARVIRQNLVFAFVYNVVAIPFAALGVLERLGGPATAAVAMAASSILVVGNALRLRSALRRGRARIARVFGVKSAP